jgi:hypothetical protein
LNSANNATSGVWRSGQFKIGGDGKSIIKLFSDTFNIDINGEGNSLMEAISAAVANTLNNLGLDNAVADMGVRNANGDAQDINAMLTQIGMQAAVGAGIDGASQVAASAGMVSQQTAVRKLNLEEILLALDSLGGVCSQVHLGWWSYEWCHVSSGRSEAIPRWSESKRSTE